MSETAQTIVAPMRSLINGWMADQLAQFDYLMNEVVQPRTESG